MKSSCRESAQRKIDGAIITSNVQLIKNEGWKKPTFRDIGIGDFFADEDGDLCQKIECISTDEGLIINAIEVGENLFLHYYDNDPVQTVWAKIEWGYK